VGMGGQPIIVKQVTTSAGASPTKVTSVQSQGGLLRILSSGGKTIQVCNCVCDCVSVLCVCLCLCVRRYNMAAVNRVILVLCISIAQPGITPVVIVVENPALSRADVQLAMGIQEDLCVCVSVFVCEEWCV
jgi:hypothetical protein